VTNEPALFLTNPHQSTDGRSRKCSIHAVLQCSTKSGEGLKSAGPLRPWGSIPPPGTKTVRVQFRAVSELHGLLQLIVLIVLLGTVVIFLASFPTRDVSQGSESLL
jgi:hypothetical protein